MIILLLSLLGNQIPILLYGDNEHLMDLLNNKMQEIPGVVATETLISLEQSIKKEIPIRIDK